VRPKLVAGAAARAHGICELSLPGAIIVRRKLAADQSGGVDPGWTARGERLRRPLIPGGIRRLRCSHYIQTIGGRNRLAQFQPWRASRAAAGLRAVLQLSIALAR